MTTSLDTANISAYERGLQAFWLGREKYSNPHLDDAARDWLEGWIAAEQDFTYRGGTQRTKAELLRLRPADLRLGRPWKTTTRKGQGAQALARRRAQKGWS